MIKLGQMVLKGVNYVHNAKIWSYGLESGYIMIKSGQMVLKVVKWVQSDKIRPNSLEGSQLGTQYQNQVIWS